MKTKFIVSFLSVILLSIVAGSAFSFAAENFLDVQVHPAVIAAPMVAFPFVAKALGFPSAHSYLFTNFGFIDMDWPDQKENPAGLKVIGYWIPLNDLDDPLPYLQPFSAITNNEQATTLIGNFVPKSGKSFLTLYSTMDTSAIVDNNVGELDGKSWEHELELFYPGVDKDVAALARKLPNTRGLFIREMVDGQRRVIGSKDFPAVVTEASITTGKATADRRGLTIKLKSRGLGPAPFYTGPIPLSNTTVPPVSS